MKNQDFQKLSGSLRGPPGGTGKASRTPNLKSKDFQESNIPTSSKNQNSSKSTELFIENNFTLLFQPFKTHSKLILKRFGAIFEIAIFCNFWRYRFSAFLGCGRAPGCPPVVPGGSRTTFGNFVFFFQYFFSLKHSQLSSSIIIIHHLPSSSIIIPYKYLAISHVNTKYFS